MHGYLSALVVLGAMLVVVATLLLAHRLVGAAREPLRALAHLGGEPPREHAFSRFHLRWYVVSLMFLAFDIEMIFMYPWAIVVREMGSSSVIEMFTFLALLLAGIFYAWREGAFRWS